jgi:hypothetical protein
MVMATEVVMDSLHLLYFSSSQMMMCYVDVSMLSENYRSAYVAVGVHGVLNSLEMAMLMV